MIREIEKASRHISDQRRWWQAHDHGYAGNGRTIRWSHPDKLMTEGA